MSEAVAAFFLVLAVASAMVAWRRPGPLTLFTATLSLFSVGYYALPLLLPTMSPLGTMPAGEVNAVALMAGLYMACVLVGLWLVARRVERLPKLRLPALDGWAARHWWTVTVIAAAGFGSYLATADITTYAAGDLESFYADRGSFTVILAFFSSLALAALALNFAIALAERRPARIAVMGMLFAVIEVRMLGGAQRLAFITPLITLFVALAGLGRHRLAVGALGLGVAALLAVSPFAVALRETRARGDRDAATASVDYEGGIARTTLQSIVDRADLLYDMVFLKRYVDAHGYADPLFYTSVLLIPVPRVLLPDKPAVLSDSGQDDGEASVLAWRLVVGDSLGSLSAFGSIVAYREGGWPAVVLDGLAAGLLFGLCLGIAARSGYVGRLFLPLAFVQFAVAKVPTSFFEALAQVLTFAPVILGLVGLEAGIALLAGPTPRARRPA